MFQTKGNISVSASTINQNEMENIGKTPITCIPTLYFTRIDLKHHLSHSRLYQHSEAVVTLTATDWTTEQCNFFHVSLTVFYFDNEQAAMSQKYVVS